MSRGGRAVTAQCGPGFLWAVAAASSQSVATIKHLASGSPYHWPESVQEGGDSVQATNGPRWGLSEMERVTSRKTEGPGSADEDRA